MEAAFVSQTSPANSSSDFDRILASIAGGIGDYLGNSPNAVQVQVAVPPPATTAPSSASTNWVMLAIIAAGVYLLMQH